MSHNMFYIADMTTPANFVCAEPFAVAATTKTTKTTKKTTKV